MKSKSRTSPRRSFSQSQLAPVNAHSGGVAESFEQIIKQISENDSTDRELLLTLHGRSENTADVLTIDGEPAPDDDNGFEPDNEAYRGPSTFDEHLLRVERRLHALQTQQVNEIQQLLSYLAGRTTGTYEGNKALARRISELVTNAGSALLFSGEAQNKKGETVTYIEVPVTIGCLNLGATSFKLRTADKDQKHVLTTRLWPPLKIRLPFVHSKSS